MSDKIVSGAQSKIQQILAAGKAQLPEQDYRRLVDLVVQLQTGGITPYINVELGKLISQINWGLEISESPEWTEALIECDRAFLGSDLRDMFIEMGVDPPRVHKKEMCRRLYYIGHPGVVEVMEPYLRVAAALGG